MNRQDKKRNKKVASKKKKLASVRAGGTPLTVSNSGLEVWLYDDANRATLAARTGDDEGAGGLPPDFDTKTRQGLVVGYSLYQDDDVSVTVYTGAALSDEELSVARWLEPQVAFLRLPSGKLCVESNDTSRIGPEAPGAKGAVVQVPPANYRVTLYRVDHEALDREGIEWQGPQEIVLLTPGGSDSDAATGLLPFQHRRDRDWVGKYTIRGREADALVWFHDYWDTFVVNLDANAVTTLAMSPGTYFRTQVPATGHSFVTAYAASWADAQRLPPPDGAPTDEYGFAALSPLQEWDGAEAMFCRRDVTRSRVEDAHQNMWLPAIVQVLDAKPRAVTKTTRGFIRADLRTRHYYDSGFLSLILSDVLPGAGDLDELALPEALDMLDARFATDSLTPVGDFSWGEPAGQRSVEITTRLYAGLADCFGAVVAREGTIDVLLLSEREDGTWILTGLADDMERLIAHAASRRPEGKTIQVATMDEDLTAILAAHRDSLKAAGPIVPPGRLPDELEAAFGRFLRAAFG